MLRHRTVLTLLAALFAVGCVLPEPRMVEGTATLDIEQVARLGRWDGERFVEVTPGSVPESNVRVIVHGWAPGWGDDVRRHPDLRAWDATDTRGRSFEPWMPELARALAASDPHAIVLSYSWIDDAATGRFPLAQRDALAATELHGRRLAAALEIALRPSFRARGGRVQLLGHSYGARVAAVAAVSLAMPPDQLTLFDPPETAMTAVTGSQLHLERILAQLPLGWGPGSTFVDNYVSMVGVRYAVQLSNDGVVDVALAPPHGAFDYRHRHNYPMSFYAQTAGTSVGMAWSPLSPTATRPEAGCWEQPYGEIRLVRGCAGL